MNTDGIKRIWKDYMEKLLNEENILDQNVDSDANEGPSCVVSKGEAIRVLRKMRHCKASGQSDVVK